jgi:hypothetical protein
LGIFADRPKFDRRVPAGLLGGSVSEKLFDEGLKLDDASATPEVAQAFDPIVDSLKIDPH